MKTPTLVGAIISYFYYFFNLLYYFIYGYGTDFVEKSIKSKELKVQIHKSITKDGCQIFSHQILPKVQNYNNDKLIFCQHGFFETGATYTIYNNSLAIKLAELGYEVWIGHNRGSSFGQTSSEYDESFWDYNIDHIIEFDLLCQIQKMFEISGKKKFAFVGQSQGGTQIMGLLNHNPMYIDQIAFLCMISPAIIIRDPNNLFD
jgi:predicted alpha/beta-fold hydrolase